MWACVVPVEDHTLCRLYSIKHNSKTLDLTAFCSPNSPRRHTHTQASRYTSTQHLTYSHNSHHTYSTVLLSHLSCADFFQTHRASKQELPSQQLLRWILCTPSLAKCCCLCQGQCLWRLVGLLVQLSFYSIPLWPSISVQDRLDLCFFFLPSLLLPSSVLGWCCLPSPLSLLAQLTFLLSRWCISQPARHDQSSPDADWAIKVSNDRPLSVMGPAPVVKPCIKLCSRAQLACP